MEHPGTAITTWTVARLPIWLATPGGAAPEAPRMTHGLEGLTTVAP
jgi:hypothetical protein